MYMVLKQYLVVEMMHGEIEVNTTRYMLIAIMQEAITIWIIFIWNWAYKWLSTISNSKMEH